MRRFAICLTAAAALLLTACEVRVYDDDGDLEAMADDVPALPGGEQPVAAGFQSGGIAGMCDGITIAADGRAVTTRCGIDGTERRTFRVPEARIAVLNEALASLDEAELTEADDCAEPPEGAVDWLYAYYELEDVGPICSSDPVIARAVGTIADVLNQHRAGFTG